MRHARIPKFQLSGPTVHSYTMPKRSGYTLFRHTQIKQSGFTLSRQTRLSKVHFLVHILNQTMWMYAL